MIPHREKGIEGESWHTFVSQGAVYLCHEMESQAKGSGARGSLWGSGFPTVDPHRSRWLKQSRGGKRALKIRVVGGKLCVCRKNSEGPEIWAPSRTVTANQPQGKSARDSSKSILREASEEKMKGKEDRCTVHQWSVCSTTAGYESPEDPCEVSSMVSLREQEGLRASKGLIAHLGTLVNGIVCILQLLPGTKAQTPK